MCVAARPAPRRCRAEHRMSQYTMLPQYTDHHMLLEDDAFLLLEELKRTKDGKIEQLSREKQRLAAATAPPGGAST